MGGKKITTKLVIWTALLWLGECETNELGKCCNISLFHFHQLLLL